MNVKIRIGCPVCGNVVKAPNVPGIQSKSFKCNVCGNISVIGNCKVLGYVDENGQPVNIESPSGNGGLSGNGQFHSGNTANHNTGSGNSLPGNPLTNTVYPGQSHGSAATGNGQEETTYPNSLQKSQPYAVPGDIIKIRCTCSQVLSFKYKPGSENAIIICPKCSRQEVVRNFQRVQPGTAKPPIGIIKVKGSDKVYQLSLGENIVGKKATTSFATIQLDSDTCRMSREHIVIEVLDDPEHGYRYLVRLYKERVNETFVDNTPLEFGDKVLLKNGMEIHLPDLTVVFEIPVAR